jgi:septum formation protein
VRIASDRPLVLGSASPRRRELLSLMGIPLVVRAASVDESQRPAESPDAYLERIALAKLDAIRSQGPAGVEIARRHSLPSSRSAAACGVLVADTIVVAPDGVLLGKPADDDDARAMLDRLSGATHDVRTRFLLAETAARSPPAHAETVITRVTFRSLSGDEARAYAAAGEGRDKAGAYAVQGRAAAFVQRIEGSYTNVVGLPLCEVVVAMRALGWL